MAFLQMADKNLTCRSSIPQQLQPTQRHPYSQDECVKQVRVLTVVSWLLYPCFSLFSHLLTALWHNGHWWPLKPMIYVPTWGTQGLCTHCSHHKECSSPGSLPSFIHDCIGEDFLLPTILKVSTSSLLISCYSALLSSQHLLLLDITSPLFKSIF